MRIEETIAADGSKQALIHLVVQDVSSEWCLACTMHPLRIVMAGRQMPLLRTDDAHAATCPQCKKTPQFKERWAR